MPSYTQVGTSQQNVVSEVTKSVDSAPGTLQRLSLAVVVDSSVKGVNASQVKQLVSAAAGLQPSRGDTIQVAFVPFDQSAAKLAAAQLKAAASAKSKAAMMSEARGGLRAGRGARPARLRHAQDHEDDPGAPGPPRRPPAPGARERRRLRGGRRDGPGADSAPDRPYAGAAGLPRPLQAEISQIGQMIEREPERIAEMLRAWLETGPGDR